MKYLKTDQNKEDQNHGKQEHTEGTMVMALLARIPKEGGQHSCNQTYKQTDGRLRILFQKKGKQIGDAKKAQGGSQGNGNQQPKMLLQPMDRIPQKLHLRLIDAESYAKNTSRQTGQYGTQTDERALYNSDEKRNKGRVHFL